MTHTLPLRDLVLVELIDDAAPPTASGIQVVKLARNPSTLARVLDIGPDVREVEVGATYVISRLQGQKVGAHMLLLPESAVLAKV